MGILLKNIVCGLGLLLLAVGKDNWVSGAEYSVTIYTEESNGDLSCRDESLFEAVAQVVWCISRETYLHSNSHHIFPLEVVDPSDLHNPHTCSSGISELEREILHSYVDHHPCGESRRRRVESASAERQHSSTELLPVSTADMDDNNNKLLRGNDVGDRQLHYSRFCCYCLLGGFCSEAVCNQDNYDACPTDDRRHLTDDENDINEELNRIFQTNMEIVLEKDAQENKMFRFLSGIPVNVHSHHQSDEL